MIFSDTDIQLKFMNIINNRVESKYPELEGFIPSKAAEKISQEFDLNTETAKALIWGESCDLSEAEIKNIAGGLELQEDLLKIFFRNNSKEIIKHTLETIAKTHLDADECQGCQQLEMLILGSELDSFSTYELYNLTLEALDHTIVKKIYPQGHHSSFEDSDYDEFIDEEYSEEIHDWFGDENEKETSIPISSELSPAMLAAFEKLNQSQQMDLLALSYQKLQTTETDNRELNKIEIISSLRASYLSDLACEVFDVLANGPKIGATADDLIAKIGSANKRSIGQLARSVSHSIDKLNEENPQAALINPLKTLQKGKTKHYLLDPEIVNSWKAVQQAQEVKELSSKARV